MSVFDGEPFCALAGLAELIADFKKRKPVSEAEQKEYAEVMAFLRSNGFLSTVKQSTDTQQNIKGV